MAWKKAIVAIGEVVVVRSGRKMRNGGSRAPTHTVAGNMRRAQAPGESAAGAAVQVGAGNTPVRTRVRAAG